MKKLLCLTMVFLFLLSFAGCCVMTDSEVQKPNVSTENSDLSNETPDNTPADISKKTVTIEEAVILDEAGIKITAKSIDTNSFLGPELKLLIENNSDINVTVQVNNLSINGYMIMPLISADVASGKKANDSISFTQSELDACGIETIADIAFNFHIFDSDSWDTYLDSDMIQIKTSAAEGFVYTYDDSGEVAYDANDIKIVIKGLDKNDSIIGPGIIVYIHNNSDQNITVQTNNVSINGFMVDGLFSSDITAGKHCISSITFLSSQLEENEITDIQTAELCFTISNADNWKTIAESDTITIDF